MLFNSIEFLFFIQIVFFLYWFVVKEKKIQNLFIVIISYIFYGWWDWRFLFLIAITSLCSFTLGVLNDKYYDKNKLKLLFCSLNIIINLSILGTFKYFNFFAENLNLLFNSFGINLDLVALNIILPVGVSFYTFQALSYTIDVYRGKIKATKDIIEFFAYICFFPQLVAGPIERATNLLPQFQKKRTFDYNKAVDGCRQILWGFFKKMVIADNCAVAVNKIFETAAGGQPLDLSGFTYLVGGILFTFQIYCDFSGYSDIAIGCARLFGFDLMRNFKYPYFSRSIPEFWRRWHISLTTWFRDYIYFPLGGSKCDKWKTIRNVYIVWAVSGLWHGANWTFVLWGMYHGTLLAIYNILGIKKFIKDVAETSFFPSIKEILQISLTFFLVVIGWIIFRAENLTMAANIFNQIFSLDNFWRASSVAELNGLNLVKLAFFICILLITEWIHRSEQHGLQVLTNSKLSVRNNLFFRYSIYILLAIITIGFAGNQSEFIYFQF